MKFPFCVSSYKVPPRYKKMSVKIEDQHYDYAGAVQI